MTLKEIAESVGVSVSTVSRVINGKGKNVASKEVQDKIWEIVRSTNYVPNQAAQMLKNKKDSNAYCQSGTVECLLARTSFEEKDQFFSELARSVEIEALANNLVLQYNFNISDIRNANPIDAIRAQNALGLMILGRCSQYVLSAIKPYFKSICYCGLNYLKGDYDQIICDGLEASKAAVEYLIKLGHTNIGYIGETKDEIRYIGYRRAMIEHNLSTSLKRVANYRLSYQGGYDGAKSLIESHSDITAVFCANDATAIGAIRAFQENGFSIPNDISIIGVDDLDLSSYITPSLTTIRIPVKEMGEIAIKILLDRINGGHKIPLKILLPFQLKERNSTAPAKSKSKT